MKKAIQIRIWRHIRKLRDDRKTLLQIVEYLEDLNKDRMQMLDKHGICADCGEKYENCDMSPQYIERD